MITVATKQPSTHSSQRKPLSEAHMPVARSPSLSTVSPGSTMLQRKPGCACGGGCPRCQDELGIQTKLKIGEPGDKYEQQAERIAEQVMRMPEPTNQRQSDASIMMN